MSPASQGELDFSAPVRRVWRRKEPGPKFRFVVLDLEHFVDFRSNPVEQEKTLDGCEAYFDLMGNAIDFARATSKEGVECFVFDRQELVWVWRSKK